MKTFNIIPDVCWSCGIELDAATPMEDIRPNGPEPGDVCLCFHCGEFSVFNAECRRGMPTSEVVETILRDPALVYVRKKLQENIRRRGPMRAG
jgi:hypothetical protein